MTHTEARRRALRAAFAVSLTMGTMSCSGGVVVIDNDNEDPAPGGSNQPEQEHPSQVADAGSPPLDAGTPVPPIDAGPPTDAGPIDMDASIADAADATSPDGGPLCVLGDDWEAYAACCETVNWDYNAGCMAWGPPVPPAMGVA